MRVVEHPQSTPQAAAVAIILANAYNCKTKQCNPSLQTIANLINGSWRTAKRAVENLEEIGVIHRLYTAGKGNSFNLIQTRTNTEPTPAKSDTPAKIGTPAKSVHRPLPNLSTFDEPLPIDETVKLNSNPPLPPHVDSNAWNDLCEYRVTHKQKKIRDSWTPLAQKKAAKLLSELTPADQIACVDLSIANGWQGIFPNRLNGGRRNETNQRIHKPGSSGQHREIYREIAEDIAQQENDEALRGDEAGLRKPMDSADWQHGRRDQRTSHPLGEETRIPDDRSDRRWPGSVGGQLPAQAEAVRNFLPGDYEDSLAAQAARVSRATTTDTFSISSPVLYPENARKH